VWCEQLNNLNTPDFTESKSCSVNRTVQPWYFKIMLCEQAKALCGLLWSSKLLQSSKRITTILLIAYRQKALT